MPVSPGGRLQPPVKDSQEKFPDGYVITMKDNEKGLYMLATILKSFRDRWLSYRIGNLKGNAFPHGRASSSYDHDPAYYGDGCRLPTSPITVSRRRTADGNHMRGHSPRPPCTFHVAIPLQILFPALHLPTLSLTSYPHYPDADSLFFYVSPISISLLSCFQGICLALHGFSPSHHLSRQCGSFPSSPGCCHLLPRGKGMAALQEVKVVAATGRRT